MVISNGLKTNLAVLMSVPLIFFGISFKIISRPIFSEKSFLEKPGNTEIGNGSAKEPENKKIESFSTPDNILPLEQASMPAKKAEKEDIAINAKSVLAVDDFSGQILYEKDADQKVKIASLTKLATAGVLLDFIKKKENSGLTGKAENYSLDRYITISKLAVEAEGDSGYLKIGEKINAGDLLKIMLIASSNDAAFSFAEDISKFENPRDQGIGYFTGLMNDFAKKEDLAGTRFTNPSGIDEQDNFSTANDVVKLARGLLRDYPQIFEITRIDEMNIKSEDGKNNHFIKNTNKLLGSLSGIVGGKTGYTDEAGESLLLAVRDSASRHQIVAVVIGADGRFSEMEKLVNWIWETYEWR